MTPDVLRALLAERLPPGPAAWLAEAEAAAAADPAALRTAFPVVGRRLGREPLGQPSVFTWTVDDAGRALLLVARGAGAGPVLPELYRHGEAAERRGVLRALDVLDLDEDGRAIGRTLVEDALRTNDARLIAAALGPFGVAALDDSALAHAVLKCVFTGLPLGGIPGLRARSTPEMARMLAAFACERVAAGRVVPADIWPLVDAFPPEQELAALAAERRSPVAARREAARTALAHRRP